ncbi:MAG: hypothetical protein JW751_20325, partial [Polyangiaceae bacterium]|nr:hypothetical protein [Polyangiaceae bacterium]
MAATVPTACQKGEPTPSEASHLDCATVAASSNRAAQPKGERREKAYSATPASKLGARPDGVGVPVGVTAPDIEVRDIDGRATVAPGEVLVGEADDEVADLVGFAWSSRLPSHLRGVVLLGDELMEPSEDGIRAGDLAAGLALLRREGLALDG